MLLSLTYVSSASGLIDVPVLTEMLADWRPKNAARGLTGMLLYSEGNIIQSLEGPEQEVDATFATIRDDPRHRGVLVLLREPVSDRSFPDWSMGFRHLGPEEVAATEGFSPFFRQPAANDLGESASSAQLLLEMFRQNMR